MPKQNISPYTSLHKRLVVLYPFSDMSEVWSQAKADWKKEKKEDLPRPLKKNPAMLQHFSDWIEQRIILSDCADKIYLNKQDLTARGWNNTLITQLYPNPDIISFLGRGRYAYYYDQHKVNELEDTEPFINHIEAKIERERKKSHKKAKKGTFGSEFIR